jgi:CBS domain-containing protein
MPLIDGARLFTLSFDIRGINNTFHSNNLPLRMLSMLKYISMQKPLILSKFRTLEGLKNDNSGQFINLNELSKIDKEKKNALTPMKELELIKK